MGKRSDMIQSQVFQEGFFFFRSITLGGGLEDGVQSAACSGHLGK